MKRRRLHDDVRARCAFVLTLGVIVGFGLTACGWSDHGGNSGIETQETAPAPASVPETQPAASATPAYDGPYNATFRSWVNTHAESNVAISGKVGAVISDNAFTLAGKGDDEDLLIVTPRVTSLPTGVRVKVTGMVRKAFDLPLVEDDIEVKFEDGAAFRSFDRDPYVRATQVEPSP